MQKQEFLAIASASSLGRHSRDTSEPENVARYLSRLLVATRALCQRSLYCHWQETDPAFSGMHSLFEQQYQSLRTATDIIADRLTALGFALPAQFSSSIWGTDNKDARPAGEMISGLVRSHQSCSLEARKLLESADLANDGITAHLATQRIISHEKAAWMLLALLQAQNTSTRFLI